ncbi:hypothetical protein GGR06_003629 [Bacteroides reticulotermitis]|uniref:Uncharacterized protein n=1 Tax=Bacteroides reticulotermitis TaxID=1133319 RepID=A0A840D044_9BACE|nr:hypothetical protein [Bacteroides reticulotermitis]
MRHSRNIPVVINSVTADLQMFAMNCSFIFLLFL